MTIRSRLKQLEPQVLERAKYDWAAHGMFHVVARSCFVKAFEFSRYCNRIIMSNANESAFFMSSALRGICEDVVTLRFLEKLPEGLRDEVVAIELMIGLHKTLAEQGRFFESVRPFQPVLEMPQDPERIAKAKDRLTQIGIESGLWKMERKLPPVEQMASAVGLKQIYDYFYRVTSSTVHFNPAIAMRIGLGNEPSKRTFATRNFSVYYLSYCQIYSVFLFNEHCLTLKRDLALDGQFMALVAKIRPEIDKITRWPEAVTFEEVNRTSPDPIVRTILRIAHEFGVDGEEALKQTLPLIAKALKK